jgi:hypothetical protein
MVSVVEPSGYWNLVIGYFLDQLSQLEIRNYLTSSFPPLDHGWHFNILFSPNSNPFKLPYLLTA